MLTIPGLVGRQLISKAGCVAATSKGIVGGFNNTSGLICQLASNDPWVVCVVCVLKVVD